MRSAVLGLILCLALAPAPAGAQPPPGQPLEDLESVHRACHSASAGGAPEVYVMNVDEAGFRLAPEGASEGALVVDPSWNLRALEGKVQAFARHRERIRFDAEGADAAALREAAREGARLRVGFFLGFDGDGSSACLARSASAVTMLRVDLAYAELLGPDGAPLARYESDRLRAYLDDPERAPIPGEGPRGALGEASLIDGAPLPAAWASALAQPARARPLGACLEAALARGVSAPATLVLRLRVEGSSGALRGAEVELSTLGDDEGAACVAAAIARGAPLGRGGVRGERGLRLRVRLVP